MCARVQSHAPDLLAYRGRFQATRAFKPLPREFRNASILQKTKSVLSRFPNRLERRSAPNNRLEEPRRASRSLEDQIGTVPSRPRGSDFELGFVRAWCAQTSTVHVYDVSMLTGSRSDRGALRRLSFGTVLSFAVEDREVRTALIWKSFF